MPRKKLNKEATILAILGKRSMGTSVNEAKLRNAGVNTLIECAKFVHASPVYIENDEKPFALERLDRKKTIQAITDRPWDAPSCFDMEDLLVATNQALVDATHLAGVNAVYS